MIFVTVVALNVIVLKASSLRTFRAEFYLIDELYEEAVCMTPAHMWPTVNFRYHLTVYPYTQYHAGIQSSVQKVEYRWPA